MILMRDVWDIKSCLGEAAAIALRGGYGIEGAYLSKEEGGSLDIALVLSCQMGQGEVIAEKIREVGICGEVMIIEAPDPRIAGNPFFPINIGETRVVVFRETIYRGLFKGARDRFGEEAAKAFLYHLGLEVGEEGATLAVPAVEPLQTMTTLASSIM